MLKLKLTFKTLSKSLLSLLYWGNFINTKTSTSKSSINQLRLFHILLPPIITVHRKIGLTFILELELY